MEHLQCGSWNDVHRGRQQVSLDVKMPLLFVWNIYLNVTNLLELMFRDIPVRYLVMSRSTASTFPALAYKSMTSLIAFPRRGIASFYIRC